MLREFRFTAHERLACVAQNDDARTWVTSNPAQWAHSTARECVVRALRALKGRTSGTVRVSSLHTCEVHTINAASKALRATHVPFASGRRSNVTNYASDILESENV